MYRLYKSDLSCDCDYTTIPNEPFNGRTCTLLWWVKIIVFYVVYCSISIKMCYFVGKLPNSRILFVFLPCCVGILLLFAPLS